MAEFFQQEARAVRQLSGSRRGFVFDRSWVERRMAGLAGLQQGFTWFERRIDHEEPLAFIANEVWI